MNNEDLRRRIGERLKDLRKNKGLTQMAAVELVKRETGRKIDYSYLGRIERGEQNPSVKILRIFAETFLVPIGYFFAGGKEAVEIEKVKEGLALLEKVERLNPQDREFVECLIKRLGERKEERG